MKTKKINKWVEFLKLSKKLRKAHTRDDEEFYADEIWELIYKKPMENGDDYNWLLELYNWKNDYNYIYSVLIENKQ